MNYLELFDKIKSASITGTYLFYGDEEYVKEQAIMQITKTFFPDGMKEFNLNIIDMDEKGVVDITNACETMPFLAQRRLVIVKNFPFAGAKKGVALLDKLIEYIKNVSSSTCLIFVNKGQVDSRVSLFTAIKKHGTVVEFSIFTQDEAKRWITSTLRKNGKTMDMATIQYLIFLVGTRIGDLNNELQKLISFRIEDSKIRTEDIDQLVVPNQENNVFGLIDCIGRKNIGEAVLRLQKLISQGENIFSLFAMTAKQLRMNLLCCAFREEGLNDVQMSKKIGGHPFVVKKSIAQSHSFTTRKLMKALKYCLEIDYKIKNGKIRDKDALELLYIELARK